MTDTPTPPAEATDGRLPARACSASFPLCPRCKHSEGMMLDQSNLRYSCKSCGTTWSRNYLTGWNDGHLAKYRSLVSIVNGRDIIPEDMLPAVDKLRAALYDNPCVLNDDDDGVHFLCDGELYQALKLVIPSLPNAKCAGTDASEKTL